MLRILLTAPLLLTATAAAIPSCPSNPVRSCTSDASSLDSCCVASPGGRFEFTQRFEPDVGSEGGSWGIESLKVSGCNGQSVPASGSASSQSYTHEEVGSYCASSQAFGSDRGFELAEKEWAQSEVGESVEEVWERAWANSGRLISTLQRKCLAGYKTGDEVPLFFEGIHRLHRSLPSAQRLAEADITPSTDTTYSLSELEVAVTVDGHKPYFGCNNMTLSTITYPLYLLGKFQDGHFEPAERVGEPGNCPTEGIRYPASTARTATTSSATWDPIHRPSPRPITLSEDPQKRIVPTPAERKAPAKKLGFFKAKDEKKEIRKQSESVKGRDEL